MKNVRIMFFVNVAHVFRSEASRVLISKIELCNGSMIVTLKRRLSRVLINVIGRGILLNICFRHIFIPKYVA